MSGFLLSGGEKIHRIFPKNDPLPPTPAEGHTHVTSQQAGSPPVSLLMQGEDRGERAGGLGGGGRGRRARVGLSAD